MPEQGGLDSLGAVELRNAVRANFGIDVPATLALDYPTVEAMVSYVGNLLAERAMVPIQATPSATLSAAAGQGPISATVGIVSVAAKYPGAEGNGEPPPSAEMSSLYSHSIMHYAAHFKP